MKKASYEDQGLLNLPKRPLLIVISGPSGAGKDTVLAKIKETDCPFEYIITVTTRPQRNKEVNKRDYHFVSVEKFQEMIRNKVLLEWAKVYGNWYGVPKEAVKKALDKGQDTIVKVDIQGAATIKKILPQAIFIFLTSPSIEELTSRLEQRRTEIPTDLALRTRTAEEEIRRLALFDYVVMNKQNKIDLAVANIKAIITAEKCRVSSNKITL